MTPARPTSWRLLVGAGSFVDAKAALRLVEHFVARRVAELGGVFLEEVSLTEIADLRSQRVVTPGGMLKGPPSQQQWLQLFERDAKAFRDLLSQVAQSRKWGFERRRGDLIGGLCEAAEGWDMLCVGQSAPYRSTGPVILIAAPQEASRLSADLAEELAAALDRNLLALSLSSNGEPFEPTRPNEIHFADVEQLLARVARLPAAALVVDLGAGPFHDAADLRRLYTVARCPLLVLNAGHTPRAGTQPH